MWIKLCRSKDFLGILESCDEEKMNVCAEQP